MVDAVVGFVINKLGEFLVQEEKLLHELEAEMELVKWDLESIQSFLKYKTEYEREAFNDFELWKRQVQDIAYQVEDILDIYILKVEDGDMEERDGSTLRRFLDLIKKYSCILSAKANTHNTTNAISSLRREINSLSCKSEMYCNESNGAQKARTSQRRRIKEIRRAASVIEEEHVDGVEDAVDILQDKLLNGDSRTYMISIYGTRGLGKTALARKLYNSTEVKRRFDQRCWIHVSQQYKIKDLLQSIVMSFGGYSKGELERINMMTVENLERYLHTFLEGRTYLVVVDDVWEKEAWKSLKRSFPQDVNGSRVILTTRIKDIAEHVDERVYAHNLRFLNTNESWHLLQKKAFRDQEMVSRFLKETARDIVQKCHGLPLAIIVLAGILARKKYYEWDNVHMHISQALRNDSIDISSLLDLSFSYLHYELKLCFLYLAIFPEKFHIDVEKLIPLLVAEGFIQKDEDGMILEDVAACYIHELMDRNLVQVGKRENGKIVTCQVHDGLRELATRKAKDLNFMNVNDGYMPDSLCRREVVPYISNKDFPRWRTNDTLRSLILTGENEKVTYVTKLDDEIIRKRFKLLRVLDFGGISKTKFSWPIGEEDPRSSIKAIGSLVHLRYLRMLHYPIEDFSASFSRLRHLETLDTSDCVFKETVDLRNLTSLRHLHGTFYEELLIGDATKLLTLEKVTTRCWNKICQENLVNLRKLEIYDDLTWEGNTTDVHLGLNSFSNLKSLLKLKVDTYSFNFSPTEYPQNLEDLTFRLVELEEDPMPMLGNLPRLQYLDLYLRGYVKRILICSPKGFPRLRSLVLETWKMEEIHIQDDSMQNLVEWRHIIERGDINPNKFRIPKRLKAMMKVEFRKSRRDWFITSLPASGLP